MKTMLEEIYKEQNKIEEGPNQDKGEGDSSDTLKTPPYLSSSSNSSSSSIPRKSNHRKFILIFLH
jgi:hypothetical protein